VIERRSIFLQLLFSSQALQWKEDLPLASFPFPSFAIERRSSSCFEPFLKQTKMEHKMQQQQQMS
jgi:hypothetical protein